MSLLQTMTQHVLGGSMWVLSFITRLSPLTFEHASLSRQGKHGGREGKGPNMGLKCE